MLLQLLMVVNIGRRVQADSHNTTRSLYTYIIKYRMYDVLIYSIQDRFIYKLKPFTVHVIRIFIISVREGI